MHQLAAVADALPGGWQELWCWPLERFRREFSWPESVLASVEAYRSTCDDAQPIEVPAQVLLPCDSLWPALFDRLERPPLSLQWNGEACLLPWLASQQAVAVVGTRRPSSHGLRMAERIGGLLADAGWPVVSGLAEGIDAAAHRGCLRSGGRPVAVLGTPLHRVYPPEHRALQRAVSQSGLLVTELRRATRVQRSSFALRNRLLVALTRAVVVVECPKSSGALLSAAMAQRLGVPVWVVPGDALRDSARGSNALLRSGAHALLDPQDLLDALGPGPAKALCPAPLARGTTTAMSPSIGGVQGQLLQLVDAGSTLEEMVHALKLDSQAVAAELLRLELDGLVLAQPGLRWRRL